MRAGQKEKPSSQRELPANAAIVNVNLLGKTYSRPPIAFGGRSFKRLSALVRIYAGGESVTATEKLAAIIGVPQGTSSGPSWKPPA